MIPIIFVPQASGVDDAALTKHAERLAQALERVQRWYQAQLADRGGTFNLDRVQLLEGREPRDAYLCSGEASCSPRHLPQRIAAELASRGLGPFSTNRHQIVVVIGGGAVTATWLRDDAGGTTSVLGDAALDALPALCLDRSARCSDAGPAGGDWLLARVLGRMLGVTDASSLMTEAGLDAMVSAEVAPPALAMDDLTRLAANPMAFGGGLKSGRIELARSVAGQSYNEYVEDVVFGPSSLLAIYNKPTYRTTGHNRLCPADGSLFSDILPDDQKLDCTAGLAHTRLVARHIVIADKNGDGKFVPGEQMVSAEIPISEPDASGPAPTEAARRVDSGAAVAYDSTHKRFQVVWYRRMQAGANIEHRLMGRGVDATTGAAGPIQTLRVLTAAEVSFHDVGRTDIKYNPKADNFLVIFGGLSRSFDQGSPLSTYLLAKGVLSSPTLLSTAADRAQMGYDSTLGRYLVSYTQSTGVRHELFARLIGGDGHPIGAPIQIVDTEFSWGPHDAEPAYDPVHQRWLVAFCAPWRIYAQQLAADGSKLGAPVLIATGPESHEFDPGLAWVNATGRFVSSFGDTDGWFFDGKGYSNAQYLLPSGRPFSGRLFLHRAYEALAQTEVAAHPSWNLAAVLRSGMSGVYVDIVQQDISHYYQVDLDPGNGGGSGGISIADPPLSGTSISVPAGAIDKPADLYVTIGDDIQPRSGQCTPRGPAVYVGTLQGIDLAKPITVTIPFSDPGFDPSNPLAAIAHRVVCRDPVTGASFSEYAELTRTRATFRLDRFASCQLESCAGTIDLYNRISALGNPSAPPEQLQQSCEELDRHHMFGAFDDLPAATRKDLRHLHFVNTMEGSILPAAPFGKSGALHRVWNLWGHEYTAFTSGSGPTLQFPFTLGSIGYYSGFATGPADFAGLPPEPGVDRAFSGRKQVSATLNFPIPDLPPVSFGARAFVMSDVPPQTFGVMAGVEAGLGIPELGDDMLLGQATFSVTGEWTHAERVAEAAYNFDRRVLGLFGLGGASVTRQGSVLFYGDAHTDPVVRNKMVAMSILAHTGGIDPVADAAAIITMALGNIQKENASYTFKQDIDETCYCRLHACAFRAGHIPMGSTTIDKSRDIRLTAGQTKQVWETDLACILNTDGTLQASAFHGVGMLGPRVRSGCSTARGGFDAANTNGISCCFK